MSQKSIFSSKINTLIGEWTDRSFYDLLLPTLTEKKIPVLRQEIIPITSLTDDRYWGSLQSVNNIDIAMMDYRHWYFEDDIFEKYVQNIASVPFRALCIFDSPFTYEKPGSIDWSVFQKKVHERAKFVSTVFRQKQKNTILVAPAITLLTGDMQDAFLDVVVHGRNLYDVWSAYCCYDFDEQKIGLLTSIINQILTALNKPLWIIKWSVPSHEGSISSRNSLQETTWTPLTHEQAAARLKGVFNSIESVAKANTKWFFVGASKDAYHPDLTSPDLLWRPYSLYRDPSDGWNFQHFLGSISYKNQIKTPVWESFLSIAAKHPEV